MSNTHIGVILDMSGSMRATELETKQGLRDYIKETRKEVPDALFSLTIFDTVIERWVDSEIINSLRAKEVVRNYKPRGWTALYDAIGKTVTELERKVRRGDKAIVVIMTDGYENSSREWNQYQIKSLITKLQAKKNWTFVFLGANVDSWGISEQLGFYKANTVDYTYGVGQRRAFSGTAMATASLANSAQKGSSSFYRSAGVDTGDFTEEEFDINQIVKDVNVTAKSK